MESAAAKKDTTLLDNIIIGRVDPHIYAFSTGTVPNYLKVGDTSRGVRVRLEEWKKIFPNLIRQYEHTALIDENTVFRDFSVHSFLIHEKGRTRLQPDTFHNLPYYSNEFFEGATTADLKEAMTDIFQSAHEKNGKYQFYTPPTACHRHLPTSGRKTILHAPTNSRSSIISKRQLPPDTQNC